MKKLIPLWIKCPIALMLKEFGKLPLHLVLRKMHWSFTQNRNCPASVKAKAEYKMQMTVCKYLNKKYGQYIEKICTADVQGQQPENAPIWALWWQGTENMPYIIESCLANIQKNGSGHPVHVIHRDNYKDFVDVPPHLEERLQAGQISLAHFSDYLRMKLLAEYGGIWVDATVFMKEPLDHLVYEMPFWTVRNPGQDEVNISNWEWAINLMGGWKGNGLFCAMVDVLERYWADHRIVATYFMTDCLIRLIYDRHEPIRDMIKAVPPSNAEYYYFQKKFALPLDEQDYKKEIGSQNRLYKLSWKCVYAEQLPDGRQTYYGRWKRDFGA